MCSFREMNKENRIAFRTMTFLLIIHLLLVLEEVAAGTMSRDDFPSGFIFGAGSAAFQVEGAAAEDGKKPSIWDTFENAGLISDKSTGAIAADQYHKYKEDVKLIHDMGLDAYRFSISWSRLIPDGRGLVNPKGLQYYNNLIDELVSYGIEPHVTLYHFDLPQTLQDEYDGLLGPKIVEDFTAYADTCFKEFGDRVKYWSTFNEPNWEPVLAYDIGSFPPGRCSYPHAFNCSEGDSTREPYRVAHNILLSHSSAVALYKDKYQAEQGGQIGITLMSYWFEPFTGSRDDIVAKQRILDFQLGWFMDPLTHGNYPAIMREIVGSRLPGFNPEESKKLKGSFDFIGLNHYLMFYVQSDPNNLDENDRDYVKDIAVKIANLTSGSLEKAFAMKTVPSMSTPWALQSLLEYVKVKYRNPPIVVHENGYGEFDITATSGKGINDDYRINCLQGYMESTLQSIRNGSNTIGYFVWSFIDSFETLYGYTARYGLYGVDFSLPDRSRFPRLSAHWYSTFLSNGRGRNQESKLIQTE